MDLRLAYVQVGKTERDDSACGSAVRTGTLAKAGWCKTPTGRILYTCDISGAQGEFVIDCRTARPRNLQAIFWMTAILFSCDRIAAVPPPTVIVSVSTKNATQLEPGFAGYNSPFMATGVKATDPRLLPLLKQLSPGFLKYPAGTRTNAFDWTSGLYREEWIDRSDGFFGNESRQTNQVLTVTGPQLVRDVYSLARDTGAAGLIVQVNTFTDSPESAGNFARYAKDHNIRVFVWQLGAEPTQFPKVFPRASDYASKMRPFADAIRSADPNAKISISLGIAREPFRWKPDLDWDDDLAKYEPRYWDLLTYHQYPRVRGSDSELMGQLNEVLVSQTTRYVVDHIEPRFGKTPLVITESDPGSPLPQRPEDTMSGATVAQPGTSMVGTLYGGIWSAEYILRLSVLGQMKHVGIHQLLGAAGIQLSDAHLTEIFAAYEAKKTIETRSLDYGFFMSATGVAYGAAAAAINASTHVCPTSVKGGGTAATTTAATVPAVYAQAYRKGRNFHVVVTNKGPNRELISIQIDGRPVSNRLGVVTVTGPGPSARNAPGKQDVGSAASNTLGPVPMPPYSVVTISW
ncbi:MAG TPA: hypothetical protein VG456_24670 [Candidatus Sulfopaludibacter sp.]|jgi:hypothetical protein|nr:hypothetical protein [Candidatus Sulfopaludibacter sp.]